MTNDCNCCNYQLYSTIYNVELWELVGGAEITQAYSCFLSSLISKSLFNLSISTFFPWRLVPSKNPWIQSPSLSCFLSIWYQSLLCLHGRNTILGCSQWKIQQHSFIHFWPAWTRNMRHSLGNRCYKLLCYRHWQKLCKGSLKLEINGIIGFHPHLLLLQQHN